MPVGTRGAVKYLSADDYERLGVQIVLGNTYHLMLRPGRRRGRPLRRARAVQRMGRPDAHRFRRLPGVLAGAQGRRRRRDVPQHVRRVDASADAGGRRARPGADRRRHPDGPRRLPAAAEPARCRRVGGQAHRAVGGPGAQQSRARRPGAVRDRPGRHQRGAAAGECRAHGRPRLRRLRHRRAVGRRDARRDAPGARGRARASCRRTGPAT